MGPKFRREELGIDVKLSKIAMLRWKEIRRTWFLIEERLPEQ